MTSILYVVHGGEHTENKPFLKCTYTYRSTLPWMIKKELGVFKKKWSHAERITKMSVDSVSLIVQIMEDPAT